MMRELIRREFKDNKSENWIKEQENFSFLTKIEKFPKQESEIRATYPLRLSQRL